MPDQTQVIGTPKYWRTREQIMQAAMRAIAERGIEGITISNVASAAGVSRGTVYNYFETVGDILESIATDIEGALNRAIDAANAEIEDPAQRLANGMRQYFRKAMEDPDWGRFIIRFGISEEALRVTMQQHAGKDIQAGLQSGRFSLAPGKIHAVFAMLSGATLSTIGILAERMLPAGFAEDVVEMLLQLLGIAPEEAAEIARRELPDLPETPVVTLKADRKN